MANINVLRFGSLHTAAVAILYRRFSTEMITQNMVVLPWLHGKELECYNYNAHGILLLPFHF